VQTALSSRLEWLLTIFGAPLGSGCLKRKRGPALLDLVHQTDTNAAHAVAGVTVY
jgi:hypothetical protein